MKIVIESEKPTETILTIKLKTRSSTGEVDLVGKLNDGREWLIASLSGNQFEPNKAGCSQLGITISNRYNREDRPQ